MKKVFKEYNKYMDYNDKWEWSKNRNDFDIIKKKKKIIDDYRDWSPNKPLAEETKESFLGFLHIDNETGEIYVKDIDGERIVLDSIDDIKKIATKKLLKK